MKISNIVSNLYFSVLSALKLHPSDYCDIETTDDYSTLILNDRSMMTFIRYNGILSIIDEPIFIRMIDHISKQLTNLLSSNGFKIGCIFRKDLDAYSSLKFVEAQQLRTLRMLDLDLSDLVHEQINLYQKRVYDEEVYFCLITHPKALDQIDLEIEAEERSKFVSPLMKDSQNITSVMEVLRSRHRGLVEQFIAAFSVEDFYTDIEIVNVLDAINFIRHQVAPDRTSRNWIPSVPLGEKAISQLGIQGYHTPVRWSYTNNPDDISYILPPPLPKQIMSSSINVFGVKEGLPKNTVSVGGRLYTSFAMDIPPTTPTIFDRLFAAFNQMATEDAKGETRSMPFSICYLISGDGQAGTVIKKMLTMFLARVPTEANANIRAAFEQIEFAKNSMNQAIVGLQVSAMTWVDDTEFGRKELRTLKTRLANTMTAWGGMTLLENTGDPVSLFQSNILGLSTKHQGTKAVVPLPRALELLPLTRPASPFPNGTVLHCTPDNKIMPLEKFSPKLSAWVTAFTGIQGSGKSVSLNNLLLETCFMPGLKRLPLMTVIDVGISSQGFINMLYDGLPDNKRHLVVSRQLRKSKDYAINPFDIRPGLQFPLESERSQMVTFLTALLTPNELDRPYPDTGAFVGRLIDEAFYKFSETDATSEPKKYVTHVNPELDRIIIENNIIEFGSKKAFNHFGEVISVPDTTKYDRNITYLYLVRQLHYAAEKHPRGSDKYIDLIRGRDLAQRYAVPILLDFLDILTDPKITQTYKNTINGNETMIGYMRRTISDIQSTYPCFCNPTEFDVDTARVVALDLQQVVDINNRKQTSLFYQAARMVGIKKFALTKDDLKYFPELFLAYYESLLAEINEDKKVLAIDEMHNPAKDMTFIKLIDKDVREGRKWGLELIFGSQRLTDYDFGTDKDAIKLLAGVTQLCLCSPITGPELSTFKEFFSKNPAIENAIPAIGLSSRGLTFLSFTRTKDSPYCSLLNLPIGQKRLWSLTTDQEERLLRDYMYDLVGRKKAINVLAYSFKDGEAKQRIRQMRSRLEAKYTEQDEIRAAQSNEVLEMAKNLINDFDSYERQSRQAELERQRREMI